MNTTVNTNLHTRVNTKPIRLGLQYSKIHFLLYSPNATQHAENINLNVE